MEDDTQTQQQLQRLDDEQILQQEPLEEQAAQLEDMRIVSEELLRGGCATKDDSSTYMCVQDEDCEPAAVQQLECEEPQYVHQHSGKLHARQYNPKKSVSFKTLVDIFQLSDAWQLHVKKSSLKTEEDQAKRRILQRNY